MSDNKKREPKKIKMPPLVDRSSEYDTIEPDEINKTPQPYWKTFSTNENNQQNDSEGLQ